MRKMLLAAEQGDAEAQLNCALMFLDGIGVPRNLPLAAKWFRRAADQGDAQAQNNLGLMYLVGHGSKRDHAKAAKWLRRAAEQGVAHAQYNLGLMYSKGEEVPEDLDEAFKWLRLAALGGSPAEKPNLARLSGSDPFEGIQAAEATLTPGMAEPGVPEAQCQLACMYLLGKGVKKDVHKALEWFRRSAILGYDKGQFSVGRLYDTSDLPFFDFSKAARWYRLAANQGHADAQFSYAVLHANGRGVPVDQSRASRWFRRAAKQGHAEAQARLAWHYALGDGVPFDIVKAHKWLLLALTSPQRFTTVNIVEMQRLIERGMTPSQMNESERLARKWKPKSSAVGRASV